MRITILIVAFLSSAFAYSQIPVIKWQQCIGSLGGVKSDGIVETTNGYLFALTVQDGTGLPNYHGGNEIWLIETDTLGNKIWESCYGISESDGAYKLISKNDQYYILGATQSTDGDVQSNNNGGSDYWVVKLDSEREIIWEKCFGSPGNEVPRDMIVTPDGGVVVMGRIFNSGGDVSVLYGRNDVWMFKTDSLGNLEWEKTLGNQWLDNGVSIMLNSEGNIILIGAVAHYGGMVECNTDDYYGDVWLVELDLQGNIVWQHCYGGSHYDLGFSVIEVDAGYIFAAGSSSNDGDVSGHHGPAGNAPDGWPDIWVVKIDLQGEIIWQKSIGGYDSEFPMYITQTEDGGIIVIGKTFSNDGDVSGNHSNPDLMNADDIWVVKMSPGGEIEWQQCYGGLGSEDLENPHTILKKGDYNYVIASSTDYGLSFDVECTPTGGNYIDKDAWIFEIGLDDTTALHESLPGSGNLDVYPNPAKDYIIFEMQANKSTVSTPMEIIDIYGRKVASLQMVSGKDVLDVKSLSSGVYFYRLSHEGRYQAGKFVVR
ncbi:MAG: T9SS type A sorting domain-containing protein [Bacteroidales bacterium]|nr:T9SS type A sorting domain-containing protein [Bacteroidales bacterium]